MIHIIYEFRENKKLHKDRNAPLETFLGGYTKIIVLLVVTRSVSTFQPGQGVELSSWPQVHTQTCLGTPLLPI